MPHALTSFQKILSNQYFKKIYILRNIRYENEHKKE